MDSLPNRISDSPIIYANKFIAFCSGNNLSNKTDPLLSR